MSDIRDNTPLVTVCVITYFSSKYVLETLDSIYNQTYSNIELVVSDDGSKDNTVELIRNWLKDKESRFNGVKVLTVEKNSGTTANCNRGLRASKGVWFKYMAGDDILFPEAIEKYVEFTNSNPDARWVWAKAALYQEEISENNRIDKTWNYDKIRTILNKTGIEQFRRIAIKNFLWYPTHFFKRKILINAGGFDEDFGIYEDYPMWLKLYSLGEKCNFLDEFVFGYRRSGQSVVNNNQFMLNRKIKKLTFIARKKYVFNQLTWVEIASSYLLYLLDMFFTIPFMNKRTKSRLLLRKLSVGLVSNTCFVLQRLFKI